MIEIKEFFESDIEEYEEAVKFFIENQLEFSEEDIVPTDLIKFWLAKEKDKLVGAAVLAKREGKYIIDGLAVDKEYRGENLGRKLYDLAEEEIKEKKEREIYLVAREPEFWKKTGFVSIDKEEAPNFFECLTCPQFEKTCFPEVMKKEV